MKIKIIAPIPGRRWIAGHIELVDAEVGQELIDEGFAILHPSETNNRLIHRCPCEDHDEPCEDCDAIEVTQDDDMDVDDSIEGVETPENQ